MTTTSCTLVDSARLRTGLTVVSKYRGRGIPASAIPSTGTNGAALLFNDISANDPAGTQYRVEILARPSAGVLSVYEDSSFSFTGAPDGTYSGAETVYKNGAPDPGSYILTVGSGVVTPPPPTATGKATITLGNASGAIANRTGLAVHVFATPNLGTANATAADGKLVIDVSALGLTGTVYAMVLDPVTGEHWSGPVVVA